MKHKIVKPKILSKEIIGSFEQTRIVKIDVLSPIIAEHYKPGQFVILMVKDEGERIPLTITESNLKKGSITIIFQEVGYTTRLLGSLNPGDYLAHLVGPLGKPTEIKLYGKVVLIGGGVGSAEIYPVAKSFKEEGNYIIVILGARNKSLVILEDKFREISDELYITTDDGSYGEKGFVSDILIRLLDSNNVVDLVYAVGPIPMMRKVAEITKLYNIKTLVSLNTIMVDGTGMCGSCRITYDGKIKYVCCDGPEFDAHKIDWDEVFKRSRVYIEQEQKILKLLDT